MPVSTRILNSTASIPLIWWSNSSSSPIAGSGRRSSAAFEPSATCLIASRDFGMPSATAVGSVVLVFLTFLYPAFVYGLQSVLPPQAFTGLALLLIGLRVATLESAAARIWRGPLISAGIVIALSTTVDGRIAAKIYPIAL